MSTASPEYLKTLTRYYEEEIEGEAYFHAIADRLTDPDQRAKMRLMAEVETYAAAAVRPLIDKYGLTPEASEKLHETARADAAKDSRDWPALVAEMRQTFPGYINDFERLEAMAPPEDLPLLKILTDHEHAAIDFLEREARGDTASSAPMQHYLKTGTA
jgi:dimethylamine/trimethylamine dehydrogenase